MLNDGYCDETTWVRDWAYSNQGAFETHITTGPVRVKRILVSCTSTGYFQCKDKDGNELFRFKMNTTGSHYTIPGFYADGLTIDCLSGGAFATVLMFGDLGSN